MVSGWGVRVGKTSKGIKREAGAVKVYMDGVTEPYESITGTQVLLHRSEQKTKNLKKVCQFDSVAQLVELLPLKQEVVGSSPTGVTNKKKRL